MREIDIGVKVQESKLGSNICWSKHPKVRYILTLDKNYDKVGTSKMQQTQKYSVNHYYDFHSAFQWIPMAWFCQKMSHFQHNFPQDQ